jgi:ribosome-binding protein aMBF1 (putative translation factor)
MLRTDKDYEEAVARLEAEKERLLQYEQELREMDLTDEQVQRAMAPQWSFHAQLVEEVESYERLKRGEFSALKNFEGLGQLLIALRIYKGFTQSQLAQTLGIDASQISRDERHEYHGITVERASRILEALGVELQSSVVSRHAVDPRQLTVH